MYSLKSYIFLQSKLYFIQLPWLLTRCKIFSATLKSGYFGNFDSRSQNQQGFKIRRNKARKKSPTKIDQQVTTVSKMVSFTKVQFFYEIYRLIFPQNPQSGWNNNPFWMKFSKDWANLQRSNYLYSKEIHPGPFWEEKVFNLWICLVLTKYY